MLLLNLFFFLLRFFRLSLGLFGLLCCLWLLHLFWSWNDRLRSLDFQLFRDLLLNFSLLSWLLLDLFVFLVLAIFYLFRYFRYNRFDFGLTSNRLNSFLQIFFNLLFKLITNFNFFLWRFFSFFNCFFAWFFSWSLLLRNLLLFGLFCLNFFLFFRLGFFLFGSLLLLGFFFFLFLLLFSLSILFFSFLQFFSFLLFFDSLLFLLFLTFQSLSLLSGLDFGFLIIFICLENCWWLFTCCKIQNSLNLFFIQIQIFLHEVFKLFKF